MRSNLLVVAALVLPEASSLRVAAPTARVDALVATNRRDLLRTSAACALGAALSSAPRLANAANKIAPIDLNEQLVLILRVREATSQEVRLIKSGKYKEVQRLNVKRAIKFILDNYSLNERFTKATSFASSSEITTAGQYGQAAVESLIQILEYFPDKLTANDLTREQEKFVMSALASTERNIDLFLGLMPPAAVDKAKAQIDEENRLNEAEYSEVNDDPIINAAPKK